MKRTQKKHLLTYAKSDAIALALNLCLVVFEIEAVIVRVVTNGGRFGIEYYTQDSNLLMLFASAIMSFFIVRKMVNGKAIPRWASILKLTAVTALLLTFLIVVTVLAPLYGVPYGYKLMLLMGAMYYTHLICPLLSLLCFLVFEEHHFVKRDALWAQVYTVIYAIILTILNIARVVDGPYPFLQVYRHPVWETMLWAVGILLGTYWMSRLLCRIRRRKC